MKRTLPVLVLALLCASASAIQPSYLTLNWSFDTRDSNNHLYVLNLDDNPSLEIVADAERAGMIFGIDRVGNQMWRANIPGIIFDLYARDFQDNQNEILAGTKPRAYSIKGDGTVRWWYATEHEEVGTVYLDDIDNDSLGEAMLGVAGGFLGNKMIVLDDDGEKIIKIGFRGNEFPAVIRAADLNSDGKKEVIAGVSLYSINTKAESMSLGYTRDARVGVFDLSGAELWSYATSGGVKSLQVADLNGDGKDEVIAGSNGVIYAIKSNATLLWSYATNALVNDIKIRDVNSDGSPEIVAGSDRVHVISSNGSKIWASEKLGEVKSVDAADFDGDGRMEYVAGYGGIHLFSSLGEKLWSSEGIKYTTTVVASDLDKDGFIEVVSGSGDSTVRMFSSKPYLASTQAARLFKDATVLYQSGDLSAAEEKAKKSKLFFEGIASADGVDNVTQLLGNIEKRRSADELLSNALKKYGNKSFPEALDYANQSRALYESLGFSSGLNDADELMAKVRTFPKAAENLSSAKKLYKSGDYLAANEQATKAKELFGWLADENGVREASELINQTAPYVEAAAHLEKANISLGEGLYSEALNETEFAKQIYSELDYSEGLSRANSLENSVRFTRLKKNKLFWMEVVLAIPLTILTIVLGLAVYLLKSRDKGREKTRTPGKSAFHGLGRQSALIMSKNNIRKKR